MEHKLTTTKKDMLAILGCVVFALASLGAIGSTGRRRAKEAVCLSNLRQWGVVWKAYTDDHGGLFTPDLGSHRFGALSRPELKVYYGNDRLLLCPMAVKTYEQGARNPFAAWRSPYPDDPLGSPACSYGINSWICSKVAAQYQTDDRMWKTPYVKGAERVPMVLGCASYQNASPWHRDRPPEYDGQFTMNSSVNEMRYVCLNRHGAAVNGVFLDLSARKIGLKELWKLKWHREFDTNGPWTLAGGMTHADWEAWGDGWLAGFKDY